MSQQAATSYGFCPEFLLLEFLPWFPLVMGCAMSDEINYSVFQGTFGRSVSSQQKLRKQKSYVLRSLGCTASETPWPGWSNEKVSYPGPLKPLSWVCSPDRESSLHTCLLALREEKGKPSVIPGLDIAACGVPGQCGSLWPQCL